MGARSRNKGQKGERELARVLANVLGIEARRGMQFRGGPGRWEENRAINPGEADVVTSIEALHIECKRSERLRLYEALDQAIGDAGGKLPIVCHRQNHREWVAIVRLEDLPRLAAILTTPMRKEPHHEVYSDR